MIRSCLFAAALLTTTANVATAADGDVDPLALAALMLRDGHPDRAAAVLADLDPDSEGLDAARFYTLRGLARLQTQNAAEALADLQQAQKTGQEDPTLHVYIAQAHFKLKRYPETLEAVTQARSAGVAMAGLYELEAEAHWHGGNKAQGWDILTRASAAEKALPRFLRRKVFYAIELGLYRTARELGEAYLRQAPSAVRDSIAIGRALSESGSHTEAEVLLQGSLLRFPGNQDLAVELARAYLKTQRPLTAAAVLEPLAPLNEVFAREAGDLYRTSQRPHDALRLNRFVRDPAARLRQRLAILLDLQSFEQVTAMENDLRRNRVLEDESIRYALAYAWFKTGDYSHAEKHLAPISESALFAKAMELRRIMEQCAGTPWTC